VECVFFSSYYIFDTVHQHTQADVKALEYTREIEALQAERTHDNSKALVVLNEKEEHILDLLAENDNLTGKLNRATIKRVVKVNPKDEAEAQAVLIELMEARRLEMEDSLRDELKEAREETNTEVASLKQQARDYQARIDEEIRLHEQQVRLTFV
jgi:hypothetical protein